MRKKLACPINYKYVHQYEYPWLHVQYMFNHLYIPNVLYMNMYTCIFNSSFATRRPSSWSSRNSTAPYFIAEYCHAGNFVFIIFFLIWFSFANLIFITI